MSDLRGEILLSLFNQSHFRDDFLIMIMWKPRTQYENFIVFPRGSNGEMIAVPLLCIQNDKIQSMELYSLFIVHAHIVCSAGSLPLLPVQMPLVPLTPWKRASPISVIIR